MKAKKLISLVLALVLVLGLATAASADVNTAKGGAGTIEITNPEIGETYTLYKLFDATVNPTTGAIAYKLPAGKTALDTTGAQWFDVDAVGNVTAKAGLNKGILDGAAFKTWAIGWAGSAYFSAAASTSNVTNGKLTFTNVEYGYYLVTSTLNNGAKVTVDSTNPTASIIDKNSKPTWDNGPENPGKVIDKGNNVTATVNTAKLEEDIQFDIGIVSKNYDEEDKIFKYEVLDNMYAGMTYTSDPIVTVGGNRVTATVEWYTDASMATGATRQTAQAFKVTIPWTSNTQATGNSLYTNGAEIHVRYTGKLSADKLKDTVVTNDVLVNAANENKSTFKWYAGNDTNPNPTDPKGTSVEKKTETYVTEIEITKVDGSGNTLTGAQFTLTGPAGTIVYTKGERFVADNSASPAYWKLKDGTYTTTSPSTPNVNQNAYESTTQRYRKEAFTEVQGANQTNVTASAFVDASGKATFSDLTEGTYTLEETVVPSGYNKAPIYEFKVTFAVDSNGKPVWTVEDTDNNANTTTPVQVDANGKLTIRIANNQGTEMPATGGMGTKLFYVIGAVLLLGAGILLVARRRMRTSEN